MVHDEFCYKYNYLAWIKHVKYQLELQQWLVKEPHCETSKMEKCSKKEVLEVIIHWGISWKLNSWADYCTSLLMETFFFSCIVKWLAGARESVLGYFTVLSEKWWWRSYVSSILKEPVLPDGIQGGAVSPFNRPSQTAIALHFCGHENNVGLNPPEFPSARHQQEWEEFKVHRERKIMFGGLAEQLKILWSPNILEVALDLGGNFIFHTFLSP